MELLEAGKIVAIHALKGEVRVQPWCDGPEFLTRFKTMYIAGEPVKVRSARPSKNIVILKLDGVDTRTLSRHELRAHFGMVLQDSWIFRGTIRENIAYGRPDASLADVEKAARQAHLDYFIHQLPQGYDTLLDETVSLSQGQKQLLCIARVLLCDPQILILDEATSSIDTRTELLVQSAFDQMMQGRTSFIVAHRLSTIEQADRILVMNHGQILEQGSHHELLKQGGFYSQLYNSQFAGE